MTHLIDKAALVAEIESKIEKYIKRGEESDAKCDGYGMYWGGVLSCLNEVRTLCDTLEVKEVQEEPVSEDLEEKAQKAYPEDIHKQSIFIHGATYAYTHSKNTQLLDEGLEEAATKYAQDKYMAVQTFQAFKAGAEWKEQQMMKDAIEAEIINWASMFTSIKVIEPERAEAMIKEKFDIGDKVKLIIVKEE